MWRVMSLLIAWLVIAVASANIRAQVELMPLSSGQFDAQPCPVDVPSGAVVECGLLRVPENYSLPDSRQITLSVAILRSDNESAAADPILYLEGGPGGSPVKRLPRTYETLFRPVMQQTGRDIILFDQRGTGFSSPALDCPGYLAERVNLLDYADGSTPLSEIDVRLRLVAALQDCGQQLAVAADLSQYHSANSARDVQMLRQALGYETVNLWGISYGTRLALTVLRDNPDGIRSVILDSVYPPDVNLFTEHPSNTLGALDALFVTCARDAACGTTYADVRGLLFETVAALNAEPVRLTIRDTRTGTTYENVRFDGDLLLDTLIDFMYDSDLLPFVPFLITEASAGNLQSFAAYLGYRIGRQDDISNGMYLAVQCREELAFTERGAIRAALRQIGDLDDYTPAGIQGDDYVPICAVFETGHAPALENIAVRSDVPALLLAGRYDPVTPPHWAKQAAETLSNSAFVELPDAGHAVSVGAGCGQQLLIMFVNTPARERLDVSCVDALEIDFYRAKPTEASAEHF